MKPNPVKKKPLTDNKEEINPLVIQSKEYMNKNNEGEVKEEKPRLKPSKIKKEKDDSSEIKTEKTPI